MKRERIYLATLVVLTVLCGVCSTEGVYYVRPADVNTCPGQPCHTLSYYNENPDLFFTSNTTFYFLPGEHILGSVMVTDVSNITLAGIMSAEDTILHCPGKGGIAFVYCKAIYVLHLTLTNCGVDYGTPMFRTVYFHCVFDLEISNIVVKNGTGKGLVTYNVVGFVDIQNSVFTYNTGVWGGNAFFIYDESIECPQGSDTLFHIENSVFAFGEDWSTEGISSGGLTLVVAESSYNISILVTNTTLHGNQVAYRGGNMLIYYGNNGACNFISVSIEHCYFTQGKASSGGGLYVEYGTAGDKTDQCGTGEPQYILHITNVQFVNNTAYRSGSSIDILDKSGISNRIDISNSSIIEGHAFIAGGLFIRIGEIPKEPLIMDYSERNWNNSEHCNTPVTKLIEKRLTIWNCDIRNNFAKSGGGLMLASTAFNYLVLIDFIDVRFIGNTAAEGGHVSICDYVGKGGMMFVRFQEVYFGHGVTALEVSILSESVFSVRQVELWMCTFEENTSLWGPNSIQLSTYSVHTNPATSAFGIIFSNVTFINTPIVVFRLSNVSFINSAFCDSSTYTSLNIISSEVWFQGNIVFKNNTGYDGGALALSGGTQMILMPQTIVQFTGNHAVHAGGALMVHDLVINYCFYKIIDGNNQSKNTGLIFENNTADYAGDAIFGGSVQQCEQLMVEVSDDETSIIHQWVSQKQDFTSIFDIRQEGLSVISSQPHRACLCENDMPNCSKTELKKHLYPGDTFAVSAVVVGQMNGTVPGVVHASFVDTTQSSLSSFQTLQGAKRICTSLRYTVYSNAPLASLRLRAENPSRTSGFTIDMTEEPIVSIHFLPCPPGFSLGSTGERQLGKCDCHPVLFRLEPNISCNITGYTVYRPSSLWIGRFAQANTGEVMYQLCPFDYCKLKPVSTKLNESNQQCNFNRYGILCGACRTTYSLMLGGSQCSKCNEWYHLPVLLVVFVLLGVLLVAFLTLCHLTVSEGTINGLIFYANIVHTTRSIYFPSESFTAPFAIFIAWLNLDFGIEVCFYSGMDTYSKTWLQFVFPAYIWLITFLMIVSSHYSTTAAKIIGRNAVKVLATLFLLSFAKLQRTIIAALSFTFLNFLDGTKKKVWVYDGNIDYLEGRHIPLFLAGLLAFIFLLLPYTLVLTFVQCLRRRTGTRMLFWIRRLKPFFDAYTGPYRDKYSFWTGLLLLVRSSLFLVFAFNALGDPAVNLLAISVTALLLAVILHGLGGVYKKWPLNILELSFFLNLTILSQATLYVRNSGGKQSAVIFISVGIAFLTFVAILFYHMTFTRVWQRLMEWYSQRKRRSETREMTEMETIGEQVVQPPVRTVELRFDQYREPLLTDVTS